MGEQYKQDKKNIARATETDERRRDAEFTKPIGVGKTKNVSWGDRISASVAALILFGLAYWAIWLLCYWFWVDPFTAETPSWYPTWRTPFAATVITTITTFIWPAWAFRYFSRVIELLWYMFVRY